MPTRPCARRPALALALALGGSGACAPPEVETALADWPEPTLQVRVASGAVPGTTAIELALPQAVDDEACPVLGPGARAFAGAFTTDSFDRGSATTGASGGDLILVPIPYTSCLAPRAVIGVDEDVGADDPIVVGFTDGDSTLSATLPRPPDRALLEPVDISDGAVVRAGDAIAFRSTFPLDTPGRFAVGRASQCQTAETDCSFDMTLALAASDLVVATVPAGMAAEGAALTVDVTDRYEALDCSGACVLDSTLFWSARVDVVVAD